MRSHPLDHLSAEFEWIRRRLSEALELLSLGYRYATASDASVQEYAVTFESLRDAGLNECDIRWLVSQCFAEHFIEFTLPGDPSRSFRPGGVAISSTSCLTLTEEGFFFARQIAGGITESSPEPDRTCESSGSMPESPESGRCESSHPIWDTERQELWYQDALIKRYRLPSPNQSAILSAFEEDDWPPRIDDPLPPRADQDPKRRLHDTIRNLNRSHRRSLLRFVGDGSGMGVLWEESTTAR